MWEEVLHYGWFAETYQWPPEVVDRLPDWYAERIKPFHAMVIDVANERAEAERQAQKR